MEKRVLLASTASAVETAMIVDVLGQNKIPVVTQPRDFFGQALDAYMGSSPQGDDIFVSEADFPAAQDAVEGMISGEK
ncbi:hypothetical protein [Christensenella intestinihominis]|uniref:hypothetical protein n=1 Tax=Christensenella intestinihominis TaxID=1851429 RepID=UPI0008323E09|nr:hypothetical protein [Christensenella intestinihominis]